jgi:hypothetical protein
MECVVMRQGYRRGFTSAEKTELWGRWQRGESLKAIGRAFGKPRRKIADHRYAFLQGHAVPLVNKLKAIFANFRTGRSGSWNCEPF